MDCEDEQLKLLRDHVAAIETDQHAFEASLDEIMEATENDRRRLEQTHIDQDNLNYNHAKDEYKAYYKCKLEELDAKKGAIRHVDMKLRSMNNKLNEFGNAHALAINEIRQQMETIRKRNEHIHNKIMQNIQSTELMLKSSDIEDTSENSHQPSTCRDDTTAQTLQQITDMESSEPTHDLIILATTGTDEDVEVLYDRKLTNDAGTEGNTCIGCLNPILETPYIEALNTSWHPACFSKIEWINLKESNGGREKDGKLINDVSDIKKEKPISSESHSQSYPKNNADARAELSKVMADTLLMDGLNHHELAMLKSYTFILEIISRNLHNLGYRVILTGSSIDGSSLIGSDIDHVAEMDDIFAICPSEAEKANDIVGLVFAMETSGKTPAGFTKLYEIKNEKRALKQKDVVRQCLVESEGKKYLSSKEYLGYFIDIMKDSDKYSSLPYSGKTQVHGPCVMISYAKEMMSVNESDIAIGIKCLSWPLEGLSWFERVKNKPWPPSSVLETIRTMPCHAFPVGQPDSDECDLEWRFAFVEPERALLWNMNDTQLQCYVICKTLKKTYLEPLAPDQINSFHVKTTLFWLLEETDELFWQPNKLLHCVQTCLEKLKERVMAKYLSHYFLPDRNLFLTKLNDVEQIDLLLSKIDTILNDLASHFVACDIDNGRVYLSQMKGSLKDIGETNDSFVVACRRHLPENCLEAAEKDVPLRAKQRSADATLPVVQFPVDVEKVIDVVEVLNSAMDETDLVYLNSLKFLSVRVGMGFLERSYQVDDTTHKNDILTNALWCFETGIGHDEMASCLYLATFQYCMRKWKNITTFLKIIFQKNTALYYLGKCGRRLLISPDMKEVGTNEQIMKSNNLVFDVVFSSTDLPCVPMALKYEAALLGGPFNWSYCFIHPMVYGSYLQFQVAHDTSDQSLYSHLEHLQKVVEYVEGDTEREKEAIETHRHYNILGYSFRLVGHYQQAIKAFVRSLKIQPSIGNSAAYHLCIIVMQYLKSHL